MRFAFLRSALNSNPEYVSRIEIGGLAPNRIKPKSQKVGICPYFAHETMVSKLFLLLNF